MASIQKNAKGWRAQVDRKGVRRSKVFPTKREALDWAAWTERQVLGGISAPGRVTFREVIDRYAREVSPLKRGHKWEFIRLERMKNDRIADLTIGDLDAKDFADWPDRRLQDVAPASVRREFNLLGAVLPYARREWGLIQKSPIEEVLKPPESRARERLPSPEEIEVIND